MYYGIGIKPTFSFLYIYYTYRALGRYGRPKPLLREFYKMQIVELNIDELKPYKKNAKKHPEAQIEHIANSLREFGWKQPVVIDRDNIIICGHGRVLAAKKLGWDKIPVLYADDLTEDQIKAFRLADNKTAESDWDFELLMPELDDIDLDMSLFGFDFSDGEDEDDDADVIEDEIPGAVTSVAQEGDIWQLGRHRLICGDSTNINVIDALMGETEADLLLTDPPYNCNVGSCERPYSPNNEQYIKNDNMDEHTFIEFLASALFNAKMHMRGGCLFLYMVCGVTSY